MKGVESIEIEVVRLAHARDLVGLRDVLLGDGGLPSETGRESEGGE